MGKNEPRKYLVITREELCETAAVILTVPTALLGEGAKPDRLVDYWNLTRLSQIQNLTDGIHRFFTFDPGDSGTWSKRCRQMGQFLPNALWYNDIESSVGRETDFRSQAPVIVECLDLPESTMILYRSHLGEYGSLIA